jgi:hypothetical protein
MGLKLKRKRALRKLGIFDIFLWEWNLTNGVYIY